MTTATYTASDVKTEIKGIIAKLGLCYVSASADASGYTRKTLLRQKSMSGGSIGPMTMTNAHMDHNKKAQDLVVNGFKSLVDKFGATMELKYADSYGLGMLMISVRLDKKTVREISFRWDLFASNLRSVGYDEGYQSYWYVMSSEDKKVPA